MDVLTDTMSTTQMQSKTRRRRVDPDDVMVKANKEADAYDAARRRQIALESKTRRQRVAPAVKVHKNDRDAYDDEAAFDARYEAEAAFDARYEAEKASQAAVKAEKALQAAVEAENDKIRVLAASKLNTITSYVSKALNDEEITEIEIQGIKGELEEYYILKMKYAGDIAKLQRSRLM